jgi:transposase InsO family protein
MSVADLCATYRRRADELLARCAEAGHDPSDPTESVRAPMALELSGDGEPLSPKEARREDLGRQRRVLAYLAQGLSAQAALRQAGVTGERSPRWAQRIGARGCAALDGRARNRGRVRALVDEVKDLIMDEWFGRPAQPIAALHVRVAAQITQGNTARQAEGRALLPIPSYESVKKYIASLPAAARKARDRRALGEYLKNERPMMTHEWATYGNEEWQIDHTIIDVWAREQDEALKWVPVRVNLTLIIDVFSGVVPGFVLEPEAPTAWSTALALHEAMRPKLPGECAIHGRPTRIVCDHGKVFLNRQVAPSLRALGIDLCPARPRNPDDKPHIERLFRTVDEGLWRSVVGHKRAIGRSEEAASKQVGILHTVPELRKLLRIWLDEVYHARKSKGEADCRLDRWRQHVRLETVPSQELDEHFLQSEGPRTVKGKGVQFRGRWFWAPDLATEKMLGREVTLRFNPEDLVSVIVFDCQSGERVVEAWDMEHADCPYGMPQVREARGRLLAGVRERMERHARRVRETDRERAEAVAAKYQEAQVAREAVVSQARQQRQLEEQERQAATKQLRMHLPDTADEPAIRDLQPLGGAGVTGTSIDALLRTYLQPSGVEEEDPSTSKRESA